MASVKKTSDDAEKILTTDATDQPVGAGYAEVDDIPDRLLILANRLQKALDSRRVAHGEHPRLQEELRRSLKRIEDEK